MIRSKFRLLVIAAVGISGMLAGGCYAPGGSGFSNGTHTYVSTSWQPYTITVEDTRTGQAIWSVDVPVGKQVVIHFRKGDGIEGSDTPDLMEWEIMDAGERFGSLDNTIPVPSGDNKRLVPTLRAKPEIPEAGSPPPPYTGAPGGQR